MIIDTNVLVAADSRAPQTPDHCVIRCIEMIDQAKSAVVALDRRGLILEEYGKNVSKPQGVMHQFLLHLLQTQWTPEFCEQVDIRDHPTRLFEEFPDDPRLSKFDLSDRKFVAVARAASVQRSIYNAVDSDWGSVDTELREHGVDVVYLCPSYSAPGNARSKKAVRNRKSPRQ